MRSIYAYIRLSNICVWDLDTSWLKQIFSEFGTVLEARVISDRETGRSRGFGFVNMASEAEMNAAIAALKGQIVGARTIRVRVHGMVDIVAVGVAFWQQTLQEFMEKELTKSSRYFPLLCAWTDELLSCSVISDNLPSKDKFISLIQSRLEAATAAAAN